MLKPYSLDLRERVLQDSDGGIRSWEQKSWIVHHTVPTSIR